MHVHQGLTMRVCMVDSDRLYGVFYLTSLEGKHIVELCRFEGDVEVYDAEHRVTDARIVGGAQVVEDG